MLSQVAELDADGRFRKSGQQQILIELLLLRFSFLDLPMRMVVPFDCSGAPFWNWLRSVVDVMRHSPDGMPCKSAVRAGPMFRM